MRPGLVPALLLGLAVALPACATGSRGAAAEPGRRDAAALERPLPHPVEHPAGYARAVERGTRGPDGAPGPRYWQQWTDYRLAARLDPGARRLDGRAEILYHNDSPDTLRQLHLDLLLNLHAEGVMRNVPQEVTGGVRLARVAAAGQPLRAVELAPDGTVPATADTTGPRYQVNGTRLVIHPLEAVAPGDSIALSLEWALDVPQAGAWGRMGWESDNLFFLAYWYPQMAVYDDVVGWHPDPFLGRAEFYAGFGSYDVTLEAPEGWVVMGTGRLVNAEETLAAPVLDRLRRAERSDEVVHVLTAADLAAGARPADSPVFRGARSGASSAGGAAGDASTGGPTRRAADGWLSWHFQSDSVRDVAFSLTRESLWDAMRAPVGDRDGDGKLDHARVDALYRETAPRWRNVARYARHSVSFLSEFTGLPYPWPHMTAVEGGGIIEGGMEFPMMTLIGDYNARGDSALYNVTVHEIAHMWVPMIVSPDERRYSWIDEGTTSFHENQARKDFFPGERSDSLDQRAYIELALSGNEGEMMRRSDYHYGQDVFTVASYPKPATVLVALRGLLGEETFRRAHQTFLQRWAYKHPYPWDFFNTFEDVSGRDLDWFWRTWYYETWNLDQAVAGVTEGEDGTRIVVEDRGRAPMPVRLTVTRADGETLEREVPVEVWLAGARRTTVAVPPAAPVTRVEIDPAGAFPDVHRGNNVWVREHPPGEP